MLLRLRRLMLFLGTIVLFIQIVFIPTRMFSAEITIDTDEHEQQVEIPHERNSLENLADAPHLFFTQSQLKGAVNEPIKVNIFSDHEVSEVRIILPEEAIIIREQLPEGTSVVQGEQIS